MRQLRVKDPDIIRLAVQDEILRSEESHYDQRLHGIILVCNGISCTTVAQLSRQTRRTVQYQVQRFEESGFAGLHDSSSRSPLGHKRKHSTKSRRSPSAVTVYIWLLSGSLESEPSES